MHCFSLETNHAVTRKIMLTLALFVLTLLIFAAAGIMGIAGYQTQVAIEREARLAAGSLRIQAEKLATSAADYGFWDDAFEAIVEKQDLTWMTDNLGSGTAKSIGFSMSFVIDANGKPIYSYSDEQDGTESPSQRLGPAFDEAYADWKQLPAGKTYDGLLPYQRTVAAIAIAPVRSYSQPDRTPTGHAIVFVRILDPEALKVLSHDFELTHFRAVRDEADIADPRATIEVRQAGNISRFAWDPARPGDRLLSVALPFLTVYILLFALLGWMMIRYTVVSHSLIRDREDKAARDPLTGLANRTQFFSALDNVRLNPSRKDLGVAVMYIDLDGFKSVNDTLGHGAGDAVLRQAAVRFKRCVGPKDTLVRLGGDEFAVIVPEARERAIVQAVAARILMQISEPFPIGDGEVRISCSIGIAMHAGPEEANYDLLDQADKALYLAKRAGRNTMKFADDDGERQGRQRVA